MSRVEFWLNIYAKAIAKAAVNQEQIYIDIPKRYTEIALYAKVKLLNLYK